MSANSKIEWCDHTFNPWIGCTHKSPGCINCYAESRDERFAKGKHWGKGAPRQRTSESNWKQPLKWNASPWICEKCGIAWAIPGLHPDCDGEDFRRARVFCASLADWLDDEVPIEWLADLLALIHATPNLDWLLLTKRPENLRPRMEIIVEMIPRCNVTFEEASVRCLADAFLTTRGTIMHNVWFGVSVEDQKRADERIPLLLQIPAAIRFLSCEPLLGPVDLSAIRIGHRCPGHGKPREPYTFDARLRNYLCGSEGDFEFEKIDWVICGGESGPHARPMHPDWARSLRHQCIWRVNTTKPVAFFFKQWGEFAPGDSIRNSRDIAFTEIPGGKTIVMQHVGKKNAGRLLDGREWNEFPETRRLEPSVAA